MATHSSILAWRIPWTEEPGGLQSMWLQSWTGLNRFSMHAQLLYIVVLVSTVQQSESAICIHIFPLFCISFPFRLPQSTEQSSLWYAVGSHLLAVLYIVVCICQLQSPDSSHPLSPLGAHMFVLYTCDSVSALQIRITSCLFPHLVSRPWGFFSSFSSFPLHLHLL